MPRLAIDIVLIPPKEIIDAVLAVNKRGDARITLGPIDRVPHISLLMGVADERHINNIAAKLKTIAKDTGPLNLASLSTDHGCFEIKPNKALQALHEQLVKEIDPLLDHDVKPDMFLEKSDASISPNGMQIVRTYADQHSFEHFWPHITYHTSEANPPELPLSFAASRLALCHLGNYCTCRDILAEFTLA
jgi:hypothetical protein